MRRVVPALLASLLLSSTVPSGRAQQAALLVHQSITEYELGNFYAALDDIARAYRLDPRPALLFNLGQCHRALHHWERAAFFYNEFLQKVPEAATRTAVEALVADMKLKLQAEVAVRRGPMVPAGEASPATQTPAAQLSVPTPVAAVHAAPVEGAPAAAIEAAPPPAHSHGLGIGLLSGGLAFGVLTGISALEIVHYNGSYAGASNLGASGSVIYNSATQSQAGVWQVVEIASAALAVVGVGIAPFVW